MSKKLQVIPQITITLLALLAIIIKPEFFSDYLEPLFIDLRFHLKNALNPIHPPQDILIVTIDEKSLKDFGRWPWPRTLQAELIERIISARPKVLAIDILYPEPESPEADRAMKNALSKGPVVLALGFEVTGQKPFSRDSADETDLLWAHALTKIKNYSLLKAPEAERPLIPKTVVNQGVSLGHVYSLPDRDGKTRWEYLYLQYNGDVYPSLSVQTVRIAEGIPLRDVVVYAGQYLRIGPHRVPTDPFGRMLINYIGKEGTFRYISATDILKGVADPSIMKNKIVLLGTSAIATYDIKVTPLSANMPGVEKNATVVENILNDRFIKKASLLTELLSVAAIGLLMVTLLPQFKALKSVLVGLTIIMVYFSVNIFLFTYKGLWLNLSVASTQMVLIFLYNLSCKYFLEERQARHLRRLFSSYVSEKIVRELIEKPEMAGLGGRRRDVTVLFSDIVGFTSLSERLEPENVVTILNEFFREMVEIIMKYDGTLDKFVGDEIMAFWGAPLAQPDHPELAVRCAIEMIERLKGLHEIWALEHKPLLEIGIGVNTGEALVGNIGVQGKKMDYTVIGDHVNLAARLEAQTRQLNYPLIISEFTYTRLPESLRNRFTRLKPVTVKGKKQPVNVYGFSP